VLHWTGSAWTPVPVPAKLNDYVQSVVAIGASSASDFWLFGTYRTTEALRWTGRTWTKVPMPEVPTAVSVAGAGIWALGAGYVMHWTGRSWATVRLPVLPLPSGDYAAYGDLTAADAKDAWVVVSIYDSSHALVNTIPAYWTGTTWNLMRSPADILGWMAPDGSGGLWADGIDINPGGFWLVYHQAGGHWTSGQILPGVDAHSPTPLTRIPGTGSLWATGAAFGAKGFYGLILKYGP